MEQALQLLTLSQSETQDRTLITGTCSCFYIRKQRLSWFWMTTVKTRLQGVCMLITNLPSQWSWFYSPYLQLYIKILLWLCFTFLFLELMTYIHRRPWRWSESSWCHKDASELPCNTNKDLNTLHKGHLSCTDNQAKVKYKGNTAILLNFITQALIFEIKS